MRGGKPVKLVIKGEAVLPAVDIQESQLDFGEVYTGVTARIPITIINTTPVLAGMIKHCCCLLLCFKCYVHMCSVNHCGLLTARIPITIINTTPVLANMSKHCCCLLLCFKGYV